MANKDQNTEDTGTVVPQSDVQNPEQAPPVSDGAKVDNEAAVTQSVTEPAQPDNPEDVDKTGGVDDGTVEKTNEDLAPEVRDRIEHEEKIVHELDENGNVTGFHKVPADGSTPEEQNAVLKEGDEDPEGEENK